ncbi:MAG: GGDEF domain-containing protein [Minisyncoccota bacterium]
MRTLEKEEAELGPLEAGLLRRGIQEHSIDGLTKLKPRKYFEEELKRSLKMVRGEMRELRAGIEPLKEVSLILIDIDHFKKINDTYGHPMGDEVLRRIAEVLTSSVRETDVVARIGGEELAILLRGADESIAARDAENLRVEIEQLIFESHPDLHVTASLGVISSKTSQDAKDLYAGADQALYTAKRAGRNQVIIFGTE